MLAPILFGGDGMNYASKVLKVAEDELGYLEKRSPEYLDDKTANSGYGNWTKYGRDLVDWIGSPYANGVAWCDEFTDWVFITAYGAEEAKKLLGGWSAYCPTSAGYFKEMGQYHYSDPQPGDVIYFKDNSGEQGHTGIVVDVDDTYVYTIEGNTSPDSGVIDNGGGVYRKKYTLGYSRIDGYGRPNYDEEIIEPDLVVDGLDYSLVYDYDFYINKWSDIKEYYGLNNKVGVFNHFLKYGMKEGRQAKEDFNVKIYKDNYEDLRKAYGNDLPKYYQHYIKWGKNLEKRNAVYHIVPWSIYGGMDYSLVYDGKYYKDKYKDLREAYGDNYDDYIMHFVRWGMNEHRQAKESFNVEYYKANYIDLQKAYGNDWKLYYIHYIKWGKNEGRIADRLINPVKAEYYTFKKGDSITEIAKKYNTTVDKVLELNSIKFKDGQNIRVK
jgi:hypothetical protein